MATSGVQSRSEEEKDRPLDIKSITKVARNIGKEWRWLGRELGVEDAKLDVIELDLKSQDYSEVAYRVLKSWIEKSPEVATVHALAQHLRNMERTDVANKIVASTPDVKPISQERKSSSPVLESKNLFQVGGSIAGAPVVQYGSGTMHIETTMKQEER